jgi:hypothetical protein
MAFLTGGTVGGVGSCSARKLDRDGTRARNRNRCGAAAFAISCLSPGGAALAQQAETVGQSTPPAHAQSNAIPPPDSETAKTQADKVTPAVAPEPDVKDEPWRTDRFYLETSLYTYHFTSDPAHDNHQKLILGEWNITENWLVGGSFFDNSFGQPSQYFYGGYRFRPIPMAQPFYIKVSAGLVHGYTGQYQNKIPLNNSGIAPVIVPSVGYCISRVCSEMVIFGGAGFLITLGVTIP